MPPPSCSESRCRAPNRPPGGRSRRGSSSWRCRATRGCTPSARRNRDRHSASTGRRCSTNQRSSTRSTTTTAPPRSLSPPRHPTPRVRRRRPPNRRLAPVGVGTVERRAGRRLARRARACPLRRQRRRREPRCLGTRPGSPGLAHVDPHRRRAPTPASRNTPARDLRVTSSPTWAPSTSCSEDCSEPAPPRPCASTRKPRRSANGCAHAASRCRALLWRPQLVGACDMAAANTCEAYDAIEKRLAPGWTRSSPRPAPRMAKARAGDAASPTGRPGDQRDLGGAGRPSAVRLADNWWHQHGTLLIIRSEY